MYRFVVGDRVRLNKAGCELLRYPYNVPPHNNGTIAHPYTDLDTNWFRVDWGVRTGAYKQWYLEPIERLCLRGNELTLEDTDAPV